VGSADFTMTKPAGPKKESIDHLKKRAEAGDVEAQNALGTLYDLGLGVPSEDKKEAAKWLGKAAKAGNTEAQFSLAEIISTSFDDTEENRAMAQALYKKAEAGGLVRPDKAVRLFERQLGKSIKIIVVDPHTSARLATKSLLEAEGFEVIEAKDGEDAMIVLRRNLDAKLIMTEVNMPKSDGYSLMSSLHANDQFKNIPIVVLSDETSTQAIQKAKKLGINGWIVKPARPQILTRYIKKLKEKTTKKAS
jgi:two-component system, chemotaxis family, chemotaxis protein CheY